MATPQEDCPNPAGHYRTVLLPVDPKEWSKILSTAYEKGFRLVQVVDQSRTFSASIVAIVEHAHD